MFWTFGDINYDYTTSSKAVELLCKICSNNLKMLLLVPI